MDKDKMIKKENIKKPKYLILDFGNVLAYATSGDWFITKEFYRQVGDDTYSNDEITNAKGKYMGFVNEKMVSLDDEYKYFSEFYTSILMELKFKDAKSCGRMIAKNFAYSDEKFTFYHDVEKELDALSKEYTLIMLSDNWPSGIERIKNANLDKYFDKMYISSEYEARKIDGKLFNFPINDYNIKEGEAIFIDDDEINLDMAKDKGIITYRMNRENTLNPVDSKHKLVSDLGFLIETKD